jgi:hypothetical protein
MKPPANAELFETPISTHWFIENGIMCTVSKPVERKIEHYHNLTQLYKRFTKNGNRLCVISDTTNSMPLNEEISSYLVKEMPQYIKARAIIAHAKFDSTYLKTFLKFNLEGIPVAVFSNEEDALKWINGYL